MADQHLRVPSINDRSLVSFFRDVSEILKTSEFQVTEIGSSGQRAITLSSFDEDYLSSSELYTIYYGHVGAHNFTITLQRDVSQSSSPEFDKLSINNNENNRPKITQNEIREITRLISKTFFPEPNQSSRLFLDPKTVSSLLASHQELLKRLESTATSVTEQISKERIRLESEFAARQAEMEENFKRKKERADQISEEMRQHILDREAELEERKKLLDDRDHLHARRQLREQITKNISERLRSAIVPARTSALAWIVLYLALFGAAFLGWLSYISLVDYSEIVRSAVSAESSTRTQGDISAATLANGPSTWFLLARGFLAGAGAIGFLVYAMSWLKNIYHANVRAHQELERYSTDLNRASWAVETIMEAKSSGGEIPEALIAGISRNLFGDSSASVAANSGNEAVASLLRASVGAKIGPSGAEFQLNGRGASKLAEKLD